MTEKDSLASVNLSGVSSNYKPLYMITFLDTLKKVNESIAEARGTVEIDTYTDVMINFISDIGKRKHLYTLKSKLYHELIAEARKDKGDLTDTEKTALKKQASLRVIAYVIDYMQEGIGCWSTRREIGVIGRFSPHIRFVSLKDLPEDIRNRLQNVVTDDQEEENGPEGSELEAMTGS